MSNKAKQFLQFVYAVTLCFHGCVDGLGPFALGPIYDELQGIKWKGKREQFKLEHENELRSWRSSGHVGAILSVTLRLCFTALSPGVSAGSAPAGA